MGRTVKVPLWILGLAFAAILVAELVAERVQFPNPTTAVDVSPQATQGLSECRVQIVSDKPNIYNPIPSERTLYIYGEVENTGTVPAKVETGDMRATLYNTAGRIIGFQNHAFEIGIYQASTTGGQIIFSGQKTPFEFFYNDAPQDFSNYTLNVKCSPMVVSRPKGGLLFQNVSTRTKGAHESYIIVGEVRNTGSGTLSDLILGATLRDSRGKVIGFENTLTDTGRMELPPGASAPFEIRVCCVNEDTPVPTLQYSLWATSQGLMLDTH